MTLFKKPVPAGPATHALVIGVGAYAHLPGGIGGLPFYPNLEGMEQLSSPPHSARTFATWLLSKYHNDTKPLATLELLISDDLSQEFTPPDSAAPVPVERATFQNVETATLAWFDRGNICSDDLLIFFFCGHGVSRGSITSLLMEDFASRVESPLKQAINFNEFYDGMDKCAARSQVFFIDSCRAASSALIENSFPFAGQALITPSARSSPVGRYAPAYYATIPGQRAYGREGQASVFTEALLKAMDGIGSEEIDDQWIVNTLSLQDGLDALMRATFRNTAEMNQLPTANGVQKFPLHTLDGKPNVLVTFGCKPPERNKMARLCYAAEGQTNMVVRELIEESDWELEIEAGDYRFSVEFTSPEYQAEPRHKYVYPARHEVHLEVGS